MSEVESERGKKEEGNWMLVFEKWKWVFLELNRSSRVATMDRDLFRSGRTRCGGEELR